MKLAGSSALTRIALNPKCGWQIAMLRSGLSEPAFYRQLTGRDYPREYGERMSARRRGSKFERNAYANNAAQLRKALGPLIGIAVDDIWVRNLEDEEPGGRDSNRVRRWRRTAAILKDHVEGKETAQILIQPQLRVTAGGLIDKPGLWIAPDVLYLDTNRRYRPTDMKSFVVRGNRVEPGDLERSRLQVATQSIALHEALDAFGDRRPAEHRGGFIFATAYGLSPHAPMIEDLGGSVDCVLKAIRALEHFGRVLDAAREKDGAIRDQLVLESVPNHFQERCINSCALAEICGGQHVGKAHELGDAAVELLGEDIDLSRAIELLHGAEPRDDAERRLSAMLAELNVAFEKLRVA